MAKFKICGCYYDDDKNKRKFGVFILNRKTNTYTIIDKRLNKVTNNKNVVTCESSLGNIFMDIL